jgi:hypothetical protein
MNFDHFEYFSDQTCLFRLEDQLLSARIAEVESQAELKDQRLKVMDLETNVRFILMIEHFSRFRRFCSGKHSLFRFSNLKRGRLDIIKNYKILLVIFLILKRKLISILLFGLQNQVIGNQLRRQNEEILKLKETLEAKNISELKLQMQVRETQRKYADLESR